MPEARHRLLLLLSDGRSNDVDEYEGRYAVLSRALLVVLGWLALLILGVLYKILPFLTCLRLFGQKPGAAPLPTVADLTRPLWGWASLACLALGLVILVPAVVLGRGPVAQGGAVVYALGAGLVLAQAGRVARLRYHP